MNELFTCPVCGFSFKRSDLKVQKDKIRCPMCGYLFEDKKFNFFEKKFDV